MGGRHEVGQVTSRSELDEATVEGNEEVQRDAARRTKFTSDGPIPEVLGFPQDRDTPSASLLGFDSIQLDPSRPRTPRTQLPLTDEASLRAHADRKEAERLLTSREVTSGQDAIAALDILLGVPDGQRGRAIDQLDRRAFDNLLDRLPDAERMRFGPLIDSSQDPKRKLLLWAGQHKSRAHEDLRRYEGDFGDPDYEQTDEQTARQERYERRKTGVDATDAEVSRECASLLKKGDALTIADVDALRARKDRELDVEVEHNVNLLAETTPRKDGSQVVWSTDEIGQLDAALDKVPDEHARDSNSVGTFVRRANRFPVTRGGDYHGTSIGIYDNAHKVAPGREQVAPVEYAATHEIGHEAERDNPEAFEKFEKAAGWTDVTKEQMLARGATEDDISEMHKPVQVGDKVFIRDDDGHYHQVDETAVPAIDETGTERWEYARNGGGEHFAEMYAMAVQTPELLYTDYVTRPMETTSKLRSMLAEARRPLATMAKGSARDALASKVKRLEQQVARAERVQRQRRDLFDIIRNDVFGADKGVRAAVARLRERRASGDAVRAFEERAARVSTPDQISALEQEAIR